MKPMLFTVALMLAIFVVPALPQDTQQPTEAGIAELQLKADEGDPEAQYRLAVKYFLGEGVSQNSEEAVRWLQAAAEQGHTRAQVNLGAMYAQGDGVSHSIGEAIRWFRAAAVQGDPEGQFGLGVMLASYSLDHTEAAKWYLAAAEQGHGLAQHNLGAMYDTGEGVDQDPAQAVRWFLAAAEQGVSSSQYNLGTMYADGVGVPQDYKEAVRWYLAAAQQGVAEAQHSLAKLYEEGLGVPKDSSEAARWYQAAEAQREESPAASPQRSQATSKEEELIEAVKDGKPQTVKSLLEGGAAIEGVDRDVKMTPLMWAALWGNPQIVRLLLDFGADVNRENEDGRTALIEATLGKEQNSSRIEVVRLLLTAGADVDGRSGSVALAEAKRNGDDAIRKLLEEAGARSSPEVNEAAAVSSLRSITTAQMMYGALNGTFADDLNKLGSVGAIDDTLAGGTKDGYRFELSLGPEPGTFIVTARSLSYGTSGIKGFFTDQSGTIRSTADDRPPTAEDPPLGQ